MAKAGRLSDRKGFVGSRISTPSFAGPQCFEPKSLFRDAVCEILDSQRCFPKVSEPFVASSCGTVESGY